MAPLLVGAMSPQRAELTDLAVELASASAVLRSALPEGIVSALATLVRAMDCYYSNLIEGHDTHPIDIERALKDDFSQEPQKRDLQLEARAHIAVQAWIDAGGLSSSPTGQASLIEIHRRFCAALPPELLEAEDPVRERIRRWAQKEIRADRLPPKSDRVLEAVLYRGQLPRGHVDELLNVSERQARRVTAALLEQGVLVSETSRAPLRLAFPARLASEWMPGLFPPARH